jgi:hypothetical protein
MVALWIRAGTLLAGDGAFGVRLLGPFAALAGSLLLAQAAEDLLPGRDAAPKAVLLLNATLLLNVGAVTMTPDAPLLFFWTLTLFTVARAWRLRQPPAALLALLTWLPAAVFLEHALGDRVQGNWPAVIYPAAVIAAADLPARWWRSAAILGLVMTGLVYLQATTGFVPLPLTRDPTLLRLAGWTDLATQVEAARLQAGASFVAADEYGIAAELDRTLPAGDLIVGVEPRWALFALPRATPRIAGQVGLLVQSARRATRPDPAPWQTMEQIGTATRGRGQEVAESYRLWRVVGANTAGRDDNSAMLPRPD